MGVIYLYLGYFWATVQVVRERLSSFGTGVYFIFILDTSGPLCGRLRGRMGSFSAGVYFIFIQGAYGPLCGWLRERMGSFGAGMYFILIWGALCHCVDGQEGELVVLKLGYNFSLSGVLRAHCASG